VKAAVEEKAIEVIGPIDTILALVYGLAKSRIRAGSIPNWISAAVAKEAEKLVEGLSEPQLLDLEIETGRALLAAIRKKRALVETGGFKAASTAEKTLQSNAAERQHRYARLPLTEVIPEYLATCKEAQTVREITDAFIKAGREFETNNPAHSVRGALKKVMAFDDNVFHVRWAKYHLKSKYRKAQLEELLAQNAQFGTGGHSKKEHSKRTSIGIQKFRANGRRWGPAVKATPELLERARQMLRDGKTLTETCKILDIATPTLYQFGIRQRALKAEGELQRRRQAESAALEPSSADVIQLHAKTGNNTG
jgi:hypothetical protein